MTLQGRVFSAVRWTTFSALARAIFQLAQLSILARLLEPTDYGLMAMIVAILGFAGLFADMGANSAFVQTQEISDAQRSSLYWLNVFCGVALTLLLMLLSPLVAQLMKEPRLVELIVVAANSLWVTALGQQVRMAAEKQLNFRPVAILEILAALVGFIVAMILAYLDYGVWSLVVGSLAAVGSFTVGAWMFMAKGWRPTLHYRWEHIRPFASFGGAIVANNIVNQINSMIDLFIGGRLLGATQLGFYSVPRNLCLQVQMMINPIVTRVGFPLIAQVQNNNRQVSEIYLKTVNMTASINAPLYIGMAFYADEIVQFVLGDGWGEAIPLLRVLAIWGLFRSLNNPIGSLLFGMGRADLALKWNIGLSVIVIPLFWFGATWGAIGLAITMALFMATVYLPAWYFLIRPLCSVFFGNYIIVTLKPIVLSVVTVGISYALVGYLFTDHLITLIIGALFSVIFYSLGSILFNKQLMVAIVKVISINKLFS